MSIRTWVGPVLAIALSARADQDQGAKDGSTFKSDAWHFSMTPPSFSTDARTPSTLIVQFYGPAQDGFSPNINVIAQRVPFEKFLAATDQQLLVKPFELVSKNGTKVGAHAACEYVYKGELQGMRMKFVALAIDATDHVLLATGTCTEEQFAAQEPIFKASLASLKLEE